MRRDYLGWILVALIVVLLVFVRTFLFQPFYLPAKSMAPTLLHGDYVLVSKFSYGYTRYSLPFSPAPFFSGRLFPSEPKRGDVVVFRLRKDDATEYIKRIVGLPGDRIQMIGGLLHINGQAVKREQIDDFIDDAIQPGPIRRWRETLPEGVTHATLDLQSNSLYDNTSAYTVPAGHYFMVGDNRDNSADSRAQSQVGYVPFENLLGRALIVFMSVDPASQNARWERFGLLVR